jgi:hypothetical protein
MLLNKARRQGSLGRQQEKIAHPHAYQRRSQPLLFAGEAHGWHLLGHRVPNGRPQHQHDPDQQQEARQVVWGVEWRPPQPDPEPTAFGLAELLLEGHAPVMQGDDLDQQVGEIGQRFSSNRTGIDTHMATACRPRRAG